MVSKSLCFFNSQRGCIDKRSGEYIMQTIHIGIDISKDSLDCCYVINKENKNYRREVLKNSAQGLKKLMLWLLKSTQASAQDMQVTLEATGVYHLKCVEALMQQGFKVCVVNPTDSYHYAKSLGLKAKTDALDSVMLAQYGAERTLRQYQTIPKIRIEIKALNNRLMSIEKDIRRESNRLESAVIADQSKTVIRFIKGSIKSLEKQLERCQIALDKVIDSDPELRKDKELLLSINGIGSVCVRTLLGDIYQGRFKSAAQCAAFMGLIPVPHQSGTVNKSSLSKGGNRRIKAKLYMAAISAKRYNPLVKEKYDRLIAKGKSKMTALCAAMQHLIRICFGVIKHQTPFCVQA